MTSSIPVVLFAYARPDHLKRSLACLRENNVPLIYAFSDGPKNLDVEPRVREVREILHKVDWCEIHIVERSTNLGLGKSILLGVSEVFQKHEAIIVFEDDLICVPGTYQYLCLALEHYKDDARVMSVTGWTHPSLVPSNVYDEPYFDGRCESWSWGAWARSWNGMDSDALTLMEACEKSGIDVYRYGADLVEMARKEESMNIWAVRFSYLHILNGGICMRPPFNMVEHIGFGSLSTNVMTIENNPWHVKLPDTPPLIPKNWPQAIENEECSSLWKNICGGRPTLILTIKKMVSVQYSKIDKFIKKILYALKKITKMSDFFMG